MGPKANYLQQRLQIAEAGYVVASIEYRKVPTRVFPEPLEDVKSAIRFLRANSDRYGIDKNKIAVMGSFAGGYLVAITGTTNGYKQFNKGGSINSDLEKAKAANPMTYISKNTPPFLLLHGDARISVKVLKESDIFVYLVVKR